MSSFFRQLFGSDRKDQDEDNTIEAQKVETSEGGDTIPIATAVMPDDAEVTKPRNTKELEADSIVATRKLAEETVVAFTNMNLVFGQASDVGRVRQKNEDSIFSFYTASQSVNEFPDLGLFVVADGMGGHEVGEKASAIAVQVVSSEVLKNIFLPVLTGQQLSELPAMLETLGDALRKANDTISASTPQDSGTTCTAVAVVGERGYFAHIGDSRAYLITKTDIEQITRDHSMVQRLVELGQLTVDEAKEHPRGNALYRALGFKEELDVDIFSRKFPTNSRLLLCSDGLWNMLDKSVIHETVMAYGNPQDSCNKLVALANEAGGEDNVSVILITR